MSHLKQGDPQWIKERIGKLTASRMGDVMLKQKNGKYYAERENYKRDLVGERLSNIAKEHYVSKEMEWGIHFEAEAVSKYEERTGNIVLDGYFIEHPTIPLFGATPDRFIVGSEGKELGKVIGLLEAKCPTTPVFIGYGMDDNPPEGYVPQMLAQCACSGLPWVEFIAYDPRMPQECNLVIRRYTPSAEQIKECEAEAIKFLQEVDEMMHRFLGRFK
jgi:hypothetical protein